MLIEWQENLSIGVLEVDIQHKLLFQKFNDFLAACEAEAESEAIYRLFWFVEAYTITHFSEEENLMQRVNYPDFLEHRELHLTFTSQVVKLKDRLRTEGPTRGLVADIRMFISGWLVTHISNMDSAIGRFVGATSED